MGLLNKIKNFLFGGKLSEATPVDVPLKLQAVWSNEPLTIHRYLVKYQNNLTPSQMTLILNRIIGKFSPDCRPANMTVSASYLNFTFYSTCMSGEGLKNVCESILDGTTPPNKVVSIQLDGSQIYPQQTKSKKK
jgi:hypothetical protein